MKIKTTMRYHLMAVRMAIFTKQTISVGEDVDNMEHLCTVGGPVNWYNHYGKQYGGSSEN